MERRIRPVVMWKSLEALSVLAVCAGKDKINSSYRRADCRILYLMQFLFPTPLSFKLQSQAFFSPFFGEKSK